MNIKYFWVWISMIAVLSFITEEIVTFMMLFLILLTLNEIRTILSNFYEDWKKKS